MGRWILGLGLIWLLGIAAFYLDQTPSSEVEPTIHYQVNSSPEQG